jgi:hypothetical protein
VGELVNRPGLTGKILRTLTLRACANIPACANILGTNVVIDCRSSNEEAASFSTTISLVGVLASSNRVSGRSAFGTISSAMVTRRHPAASRVALARRAGEESLRRERNWRGRISHIVSAILRRKRAIVNGKQDAVLSMLARLSGYNCGTQVPAPGSRKIGFRTPWTTPP